MTQSIPDSVEEMETQFFSGITSQIGNTPLLELDSNLFDGLSPNVNIFAKAEWFNPAGSVKDRPAWNMIKQGLISGELTPRKTIIDASSGNTGIALAMVGASLGYKVTICIPKNASPERLQLLDAYGAEIILTDPLEGTDGAIERVREIVADNADNYFYTDQYNNDANWQAHYQTTGPEIYQQTKGGITHFVTGLGTSGTFRGITSYLKETDPDICCISMQPDTAFHGLEGLKHMETAIQPGIYEPDLGDQHIVVSTTDAQKMTRKLANAGILVGISSGANLCAALKIARDLDHGTVVTIFCDRGERYLSENFWEANE